MALFQAVLMGLLGGGSVILLVTIVDWIMDGL